jgi:hypothetical protein
MLVPLLCGSPHPPGSLLAGSVQHFGPTYRANDRRRFNVYGSDPSL